MVTLYKINYGLQTAAPTLEKETYLSSFFHNDGVKEVAPGVWRIEAGVGSDIWYDNIEEAKATATKFYLDQIKFFSQAVCTIDKFTKWPKKPY